MYEEFIVNTVNELLNTVNYLLKNTLSTVLI